MTILTSQAGEFAVSEIMNVASTTGVVLQSLIAKRCAESSISSLHVIVPTGRQVRNLQRDAVREYMRVSGKPLTQSAVTTLEGFINALWSKVPGDTQRTELSDAFRLVLFDEAIRLCVKNNELKFFSKDQQPVSSTVTERLADVIYGLRRKGIRVEDIEQDINEATRNPHIDIEPNRLRDICSIYKRYIELCGNNLFDAPARLQIVTDALLAQSSTLQPQVLQNALILIQGFSEFTLPEQRLLTALAMRGYPVVVTFDYTEVNGPLFGNLHDTITALKENGYRDKSSTTSTKNLHGTEYIKRWLFNTEKDIRNTEFDESLRVVACENIRDEVQTILRYVKHLIIHKKQDPGTIAIAMRMPESYSPLFREYGESYGIPLNITDRYSLRNSPVVTGIFAVLNIIAYDYRLQDVHRALQNPFITFKDADGKPIDAVNLYDMAVELRIRSRYGRNAASQWLQTFERYIANQKKYISSVSDDGITDENDVMTLHRSLSRIQKAYNDFKHVTSYLTVPKRKQRASEFTRFIKESIIVGLGIRSTLESLIQNIVENSDNSLLTKDILERDTRAFAEFLRILDEIAYILSKRNGDAPVSFDEYLRILNSAVRGSRYQIKEEAGAGVMVTSLEQLRGIPFSNVILCGLNDGTFPLAYSPEAFLGRELPDSEQRHIQAERMLFYHTLTNNPDALSTPSHILLTYPQFTMNGEDMVRSPFVENILKISSPLQKSNGVQLISSTSKLRTLVHTTGANESTELNTLSDQQRRDYL
ncbi:MAG: exodeoxyribonuclease V subunit gamma, partial [Candidatus Kapabacteria bacterium]|nr:exodeoxyribonuclease V subunit gamma [Candidatus Kapabacteria bacterium]